MANNKLAIIGGSGLYDVEEFKERELIDLNTPWGKPSDQILKTNYKNKEVYFLPRHEEEKLFQFTEKIWLMIVFYLKIRMENQFIIRL